MSINGRLGDHAWMTQGSVLPFVAAVLCAGCHGGDPNQASASNPAMAVHPTAAPKRGPTPDELTAGMVEAVSIGKSTAPVAVKFDLPHPPMVGQPLEVVIAVMPQVAATSAEIEVTGSDGLQLGTGAQPATIPSVDATQVYRVNIPVTPSAEGVQFLGLVVSLKRDEVTESRSFSVPLIVVARGADGASNGAAGGKQDPAL
jgi:hypothetical protein